MTPVPAPPWRAVAIVLWTGVAVCSAWLFAPIVAHGYFIADDFASLVDMRGWEANGILVAKLFSKFAAGMESGENHFYRPLSFFTLGLNYMTSGLDATGWMAGNTALHLGTGVLVAALGARLASTGEPARAAAAGALGAAMFLFAAPTAEVVGWICTRYDATATFFTLAAATSLAFSARPRDAAWWTALATGIAALLSKESSASMPFAVLAVSFAQADGAAGLAQRSRAAIVRAAPWLALAVAYLAVRWAIFGSATQVYAHSSPMTQALALQHWESASRQLPRWLEGEFAPARRFHWIAALTLAQLVLVAFVRPGARVAAAAAALVTAASLALLIPHLGALSIGIGGRLFYMTIAFYGVLVTIGLLRARLLYLMWGVTLGVAILHVAAMHAALERWQAGYAEMRALVAALQDRDKAQAPGDFTLVVVQDTYDGLPFARNAQGGLELPPLFAADTSRRSLVQLDWQLAGLGAPVKSGEIGALRENDIFDVLGGKVAKKYGVVYPARVICWDPVDRRLLPIDAPPGPDPDAWANDVARAYARSPCAAEVDTRRR